MKFHLVPVGEKFEFEGEVYVKADKLIANNEKTGKNRLIPRSANVQPVNAQADATPKVVEDHKTQTARVLEEFDNYHQQCLQCLSELNESSDPGALTRMKDEMETARKKFIDRLLA